MKFGLVGHPLGHSYSPFLHQQFGDYGYELFDLDEKELASFFKKKEFKGVNVTIPYKQTVIPYLDEVDESVDKIGACNTIVNNNGVLKGYNTDFYGLKTLIEESGISIKGKTVAILGTGGTSKTSYAVISSLGAKKILIVSRDEKPGCISYDDLYGLGDEIQIVLNATPVGMSPNYHAKPINLSQFSHLEGVVDVIYNPLRSLLVQEAQSLGLIGVGGLRMLAGQAYKA
ncbi:MAG: shikimate dehydrogenase, partial [Bacilli bacterium]|nr:shikimate dehydrogenase [Bacilli bacterium]